MSDTPDLHPFLEQVKRTAAFVNSYRGQITNVSDRDADGIAAAYCVRRLARTLGLPIETVFIERPFEAVWQHIYSKTSGLVIITDHGGEDAQLIADIAKKRPTIIVDHHGKVHPQMHAHDTLHLLNSNAHGVSGDKYASGSTIAGLLAITTQPRLADDAHLYLLGAIGDGNHRRRNGQLSPGGIDGLVMGHVDPEKFYYDKNEQDPNRRYMIKLPDGNTYHASALADILTRIGCINRDPCKTGYALGAALGLSILEHGKYHFKHDIQRSRNYISKRYRDVRAKLRDNKLALDYTKNVVAFHINHEFRQLALKSIGDFTAWLIARNERHASRLRRLPECAYVLGAMPVQDQSVLGATLPAFPDNRPRYKISVRTTSELQEKIQARKAPTVRELVARFLEKSGQNAHDERGAGTLRIEDFEDLPARIQAYVEGWTP